MSNLFKVTVLARIDNLATLLEVLADNEGLKIEFIEPTQTPQEQKRRVMHRHKPHGTTGLKLISDICAKRQLGSIINLETFIIAFRNNGYAEKSAVPRLTEAVRAGALVRTAPQKYRLERQMSADDMSKHGLWRPSNTLVSA